MRGDFVIKWREKFYGVLVSCLLFTSTAGANPLEIHIINVQWGMSVLIRGPDGTLVLFDGGNSGRGKSDVVPYLKSLGVTPNSQFACMVLSHHHEDHFGGLTEIIDGGYIHFKKIYDHGHGRRGGGDSFNKFKTSVKKTDAGVITDIRLGETILLGDGAKVTCVAANGRVVGNHRPVPEVSDENDRSICLLVQYGEFDFLSCGDLGGGRVGTERDCTHRNPGNQVNMESSVAAALLDDRYLTSDGVEILHINHHGSESSSNSEYINKLTPRVAVISVGTGQAPNFQLPRKNVVDNVLLGRGPGSYCMTHIPELVLQTADGPMERGSKASNAGYSVGDIVVSTNGARTFKVWGTGEVGQGDSEIVKAKLPRTFNLDGVQ